MKPETKYTKSDHVNIAYQVFGSGTVDLVYIPGWVSNIDMMWENPELVNFLQQLGKIARVILFDKRGTGLSDRIVEFPTLEERMDDIRVVMDAVSSKKAILFGHSEGGSVSALFSAIYPNRVIALVTFGIFAKRRYSDDYPWAPTDEERQMVYEMIENNWGGGAMNLESLAPSKANDPVFMNWLASYFRAGASPRSALALTKMNTQVDIIAVLDAIKVPTLIMQRTHDIDVKIEEGRFIAARIQDAKLVEFEGSDHLFWVGNTDEVLDEIKAFISDLQPKPIHDKQLFTIIVGRVQATTVDSGTIRTKINQCIGKHGGGLALQTTATFTATFDGPSKAVHCSTALITAMKALCVSMTIGIHIKECTLGDQIIQETKDLERLVHKQSIPDHIILTETVKNLVVGTNLYFMPSKTIFQTDTGYSLQLFTIDEKSNHNSLMYKSDQSKIHQHDSFLEDVIQKINNHLSNEQFGVEMLCKELGISERQLQRKLKAITNKSPNKLISSVRLNRAKELLISQQKTISEIAFYTGFANPSYFSKCFKKEFAIRPSDLVKS